MSAREVLAGIPHDGPAIFLYLVLALCLGLAWRAGRRRTPNDSSHERSP